MSKKSIKYLGNPNLKAAGVNVNFSPEQIEEYIKCSKDPLYFIKNYVKIVSLDKGVVPFEPYDYQEKMIQTIHENRFVIGKLPRQLVNCPVRQVNLQPLLRICYIMCCLIRA